MSGATARPARNDLVTLGVRRGGRTAAAAGVAALVVLFASGPARADDEAKFAVCPTRDKSEQVVQSKGSLMPDGCKTLTLSRVPSAAGPMCLLKIGEAQGGTIGSVISSFTVTEWWTACANVRAP